MSVEFRDLKAQYRKYKTEIDSAIQEVLNNTNFILRSVRKTYGTTLQYFP